MADVWRSYTATDRFQRRNARFFCSGNGRPPMREVPCPRRISSWRRHRWCRHPGLQGPARSDAVGPVRWSSLVEQSYLHPAAANPDPVAVEILRNRLWYNTAQRRRQRTEAMGTSCDIASWKSSVAGLDRLRSGVGPARRRCARSVERITGFIELARRYRNSHRPRQISFCAASRSPPIVYCKRTGSKVWIKCDRPLWMDLEQSLDRIEELRGRHSVVK